MQRDSVTEDLRPDYNVAPTKPVYAVLTSPALRRPDDTADRGTVARELRVVRWGLVPFWAKDISIGSRLINARAETVSEKPAFRRAFERRRCLLPADGYYEWQQPSVPAGEPDGGGGTPSGGAPVGGAPSGGAPSGGAPGRKPAKQPFYITSDDGRPLAFAGLYELWRDAARPDDDPDAWLWTATVITTSAPDQLGQIHDRMPMVIDPASWADWLDPAQRDPADLRALLAPAADRGLISYPVSRAVNSVRNNGPELIARCG